MTTTERAGPALITVGRGDTIRDAVTTLTRAFELAGISAPATDARFLVQGIMRCDAAALLRDPDRQVDASASQLTDAARRRLAHEPVTRILGEREFYGRMFRVTPDVLDPRPDTETLIDLVLDIVRADPRLSQAVSLVDIGVGSGAIIATLLAELPYATGIATDISDAALGIARENAAALGVDRRLMLVRSRGVTDVQPPAEGFDIVVSNPPYIPAAEIAGLEPEVTNYDPHLALDGGPDGLRIYREMAKDISRMKGSVWVCLEVGSGQAEDVEAIFAAVGAVPRYRRHDLGGHVRVVALQLQL